jgi:hypothetical protein
MTEKLLHWTPPWLQSNNSRCGSGLSRKRIRPPVLTFWSAIAFQVLITCFQRNFSRRRRKVGAINNIHSRKRHNWSTTTQAATFKQLIPLQRIQRRSRTRQRDNTRNSSSTSTPMTNDLAPGPVPRTRS